MIRIMGVKQLASFKHVVAAHLEQAELTTISQTREGHLVVYMHEKVTIEILTDGTIQKAPLL